MIPEDFTISGGGAGNGTIRLDVIDDDSISPRLSATWNPSAESPWSFSLGYARYAGAIANTVAVTG